MSFEYSETNLVEQATIDILKDLNWQVETAWKNETFGTNSLLGRENKSEVILSNFCYQFSKTCLNLPKTAYKDAYLKIAQRDANKKLDKINKEKYNFLKDGVKISFTDNNEKTTRNLKYLILIIQKITTFSNRQFEIQGDLYLRRPDIVGL